MLRIVLILLTPVALPSAMLAQPKNGNRLAYLDEVNPYYPSRDFPKVITPQWVGEEDVEAVVILAIDDMRDHKKYEAFLRPILNRLQKIDGRAPVSIMSCSIDPKEPHLQQWLKEGLSIECHTYDHPCPLFKNGFDKAKGTYERCVDLMSEIPNNKPVAFRVPCCDSLNTPSPRFYAEIFNQATEKGNFLRIDSSVFNVFTADDRELPRELVQGEDGKDRFKRYLPLDRSFVNTIENYPYPYVIGRRCWQFPCVTPSDWQAQHLQKPNNPQTVKDWKAALDCTVIKKGVFCLVFHPHGWIKNDQVVDFIDHAVQKHGKKVKFLTFREAADRLEKNLLLAPVRAGGHVLDVNADGWMDVVSDKIGTRLWSPKEKAWTKVRPAEFKASDFGQQVRFGVLQKNGWASVAGRSASPPMGIDRIYTSTWHFHEKSWKQHEPGSETIMVVKFEDYFVDFLLRDLDGNGVCESLGPTGVVQAFDPDKGFRGLPFTSPLKWPTGIPAAKNADPGFRLLDLDGDGKLDIIFSNEKEYGIYQFENMEKGWSKKIVAGKRGDSGKRDEPGASAAGELPMISRNGTNNGFWVHSGHLWWSNEDTVLLKDHVDRRSIKQLLAR